MTATRCEVLDPATDFGFLLHKNPARPQHVDLPVGRAHVFYPRADEQECTVALLLEVSPVDLVRGRRFGDAAAYVDDRAYAASSMLAVALGKVFATARSGRCDARPQAASAALPLTVHLPSLPCAGGAAEVASLFEPLGWSVEAVSVPLDEEVPTWGDASYLDVVLTGHLRLADALSHLYVLLPVLGDDKHYWVGPDEVTKLIRSGGAWLADHPLRELITRRYLAHQSGYVRDATSQLIGEESQGIRPQDTRDQEREAAGVPLKVLRCEAVMQAIRDVGAHSVVDVGCGEGVLLAELLTEPGITEVIGVDVSARELARAEKRLGLDRMGDRQRDRLTLRQSSVTYRDGGLRHRDAMVLMEVIEHVDADRLPALERTVFGFACPASVVLTTPNAEYNVRYPALAAGEMRHPDHRFEWTRAEFAAWARRVADEYGYAVECRDVGDADPQVGPPTQLALFTRTHAEEEGR